MNSCSNWSSETVHVGIVHLHRADAHQAEQLARFFVAVACAVFRQADGQVAVGALLRAEDLVMHRAVHRLDVVLHAFQLHRRIHATRHSRAGGPSA